MKSRPIEQAAALTLALLLTLGTLGAIDHLAVREAAAAQWACGVAPARG